MLHLIISIEWITYSGIEFVLALSTYGQYVASIEVWGKKQFINLMAASREEAISLAHAYIDATYPNEHDDGGDAMTSPRQGGQR